MQALPMKRYPKPIEQIQCCVSVRPPHSIVSKSFHGRIAYNDGCLTMFKMATTNFQIMHRAFSHFKYCLSMCYRMPPSSKFHSEPHTKGFIFSFFKGGVFSLNNFLQLFDTERNYFSKTALFLKINFAMSKTMYIFVAQLK